MYFIHIATMSDGEDFVSFLKGQHKLSFQDTEEFQEWLLGKHVFPLELYIDGATYRFEDADELLYFTLGFETAMRLLK